MYKLNFKQRFPTLILRIVIKCNYLILRITCSYMFNNDDDYDDDDDDDDDNDNCRCKLSTILTQQAVSGC